MSWIAFTILFVLLVFAAAFALTEWMVGRRPRRRDGDDNSAMG